MAHVTPALWAPVEAEFGTPVELDWTYEITPPEMQMVVSSTRGQTRLHDVTVFLFGRGGDLALIRKHGYPEGGWRAPGGGIDPGEAFADGALREAREETGLEATLTRYLLRVRVSFTCGGQVQPWTTHVLTADSPGGPLATGDPHEIEAVKWGTMAELIGPVEQVLLSTGRGLFRYRTALHREVARLLAQP